MSHRHPSPTAPASRMFVATALLAAALLATALLAACSAESGSPDGTILRDSADISIVENAHARPGWGDDGWTLSTEPELRIGSPDATGPEQLHRVMHGVFLSGDRIAVVDGQTDEVRIFDLDGEHLQTLGGRGEGPGEFTQPWRVYRGPADSLLVVDLYRAVSVFDPEGTYVRRFVPDGLAGESQGVPQGQFSDGSLLFSRIQRLDPDVMGIQRTEIELVRIDLDGAVVRNFGLFDHQTVRRTAERSQYIFGAIGEFVVRDSTILYGPGDRFEVRALGPDGSAERLVRLDVEPDPVTQADRDAWIEAMVGSNPNIPEETLRELFGPIESPPHFPYHGPMLVDDRGHLWVRDYQRGMPIEAGSIHVFDPGGAYLGPVPVPAGVGVYEIRGNRLLARWVDDFEVQHVVVYRIEGRETG